LLQFASARPISCLRKVRAGSWLFFTGHEATDFENGIAASVAGKSGLPLGGGDLQHIVRANMNVSMLAVLPGGGREPKPARADNVPVPQHSGFIASLISGDYVFVAGQMPNNEAMNGLAPKAYRAPNALWNGTDIRLQTEFLITDRLKPGLEAGGSSLKNAIKAQVYLSNINDLPEFLDVWRG